MNMNDMDQMPTAESPPAAKKKKKESPTKRSLDYLRNEGLMAGVVEKWNMHAKPHPRTVDLFGFIDIIAVDPSRVGCTGVQCTAASGIASRIHKVMDPTIYDDDKKGHVVNPLRQRAINWCISKNRLLFFGWKKNIQGRWVVDVRELVETLAGWDVVKLGASVPGKKVSVQEVKPSANPF